LRDMFIASRCDYCLLLDSDAWPIRTGWYDVLIPRLRRKQFVAPVRAENMDGFPHVSVLFFPQRNAHWILPLASRRGNGGGVFLNRVRRDVGSALPIRECFPLLRSNVMSVSPLRHSIYFGVAYHCGQGSRVSGMNGDKYWGTSSHDVFAELGDDPFAFVARLSGMYIDGSPHES
jgi:hypothetical protein